MQGRLARGPPEEATRARLQVEIEVAGIDGGNNADLPGTLMNNISAGIGVQLTEITNIGQDLVRGTWRGGRQEGGWNGRISLQLGSADDIPRVYKCIHGKAVIVSGTTYTVAVTTVTNAYLDADMAAL